MKIETERLSLRTYIESDYLDVFEIYSNPMNCEYLLFDAWDETNGKELFKKKLESTNYKECLNLAVVFEDKVIGDLVVRFDGMKDTYEIGYGFNETYHDQGFAYESCKALIEWLFISCNAHRLVAYLDARNEKSAALCERLGMRREAHYIQDFWYKDAWSDSFVYCILNKASNSL